MDEKGGEKKGPLLEIIFRSCGSVYSYHNNVRVVDVSKPELLLTCFQSLLTALVHADTNTDWRFMLTIVDDHSDGETINEIKRLSERAGFSPTFIALEETGNGASLSACYQHAKESDAPVLYFVEDDYLHAESALTEMIDTFVRARNGFRRDAVVHPYDSPDRYAEPYPSQIIIGAHRYWRTVRHTTGTFMVPKRVFMEYIDRYEAFAVPQEAGILEDGTINAVYEKVPCISPIPSLAVHMETSAHIPPFTPWRAWWDDAYRERTS